MARVIAITEGAPDCSLVVDANQGFSPTRAVGFTREMIDRGISIRLIEQPVDAADLEGMRYVTEHVGVPVFADEPALTPADVIDIARYKAASGVNIKMMKSGLIGSLEIMAICRAAGLGMMFGCMLESKVGQSAVAHLACGAPPASVFDLDSDLLIARQPISGGVTRRGPSLKVSDLPGLGCEVVESEL